MTDYSLIDPTLSEWAERQSLTWLTDYQGSQVRTLFLNEGSRDKIQIWVDAPYDGSTVVHAVQYKIGGKKKHSEDIACDVSQLSKALDRVLALTGEWQAS